MSSTKSHTLNNFIGGRNKTINEVRGEMSPSQDIDDGRFRVILDGYQRWRLVSCEPESSESNLSSSRHQSKLNATTMEQTFREISRESVSQQSSSVSPERKCVVPSRGVKPPSRKGSSASSKIGNREHVVGLHAEEDQKDAKSSHPNSSRTSSRTSYKGISEYTRANVFPGVGNSFWRTSFNDAYRKPQISPPWEHEKFYGIKTDNFMQWAESDVYRQRLMKAWDKYLTEKAEEEGILQEIKHTKVIPVKKAVIEPEKTSPRKKKKHTTKKVPENTKGPGNEKNSMTKQPQTTVIEVKPAPNAGSDNDFWDFYDQPFK